MAYIKTRLLSKKLRYKKQKGGVDVKKIMFLAAATILKLVSNVASIGSVKEIRDNLNLSNKPEYVDLNHSLQDVWVDLYGDERCNQNDMIQYEIKKNVAFEQTKIANANVQHPNFFFQPMGTMPAIELNNRGTGIPLSITQYQGTKPIQLQYNNQTSTRKRKHRKSQLILQNEKMPMPSPPNPFSVFEENKFKLENCKTIANEFNESLNAFIRLAKDTDTLELDEYIKHLEHQINTLNEQVEQSKANEYVYLLPPILASMNEIYKLIKLKIRDLASKYEMKTTSARTRGLSNKERQILFIANKIIMDHFKTTGIIKINEKVIQNIERLSPIASEDTDDYILPIDEESEQLANRHAIVQSILASRDNQLVSTLTKYVQYDANDSDSEVDIFGRSRPMKIDVSGRLSFNYVNSKSPMSLSPNHIKSNSPSSKPKSRFSNKTKKTSMMKKTTRRILRKSSKQMLRN